jgi:hypothetical protein
LALLLDYFGNNFIWAVGISLVIIIQTEKKCKKQVTVPVVKGIRVRTQYNHNYEKVKSYSIKSEKLLIYIQHPNKNIF